MEYKFKNTTLGFKERARELSDLLTIDEKISQMLHFSPAIPRLGIPSYNWWNESLHGVARAGTATVFPQSIGMAATFDENLVYECACVISDEARAKHHEFLRNGDTGIYKGLTFWSPNINIFRDPRWGRGHETYGEDPMLTGRMGAAFVKGMQGDDDRYLKTVATPKHYAVHSGPEKLRHSFDAMVPPKDLFETYLPAFRDCIKEAGAYSVMGAYNRVNSEACCASGYLLEEVLRNDWGFEGYVVSDCHAICDIHLHHKITSSAPESAALAVKKGCDLNCGNTYASLSSAYAQGLINEAEIDKAVTRLFEARMRLGMFDPPESVPYASIPYSVNDCPEHHAKSLEAAKKSITLLKNNGILPLSKNISRIAVVGPNADDRDVLLANYKGVPSESVTVLEGIREVLSESEIYYSQGCHICQTEPREDEALLLSEAVSCTRHADVVIAVTGLNAEIEGEEADPRYPEFGGGDRDSIVLRGLQDMLIGLLAETGKPVIVVNLSGSAVALGNADSKGDAVIQAWYPGALGGRAVAEVLFGDFSPSGKLPLTFYESDDQLPPFEDYSMQGRTYRYFTGTPLYPFGYGLTYSDFTINPACEHESKIEAGGSVDFTFEIFNAGNFDSGETVQAYVKTPASGHGYPLYELKAFKHIFIKSGKTDTVSFTIGPRELSSINEQGLRVVVPGEYTIYFGFSQPDMRSKSLTGINPVECVIEIEGDMIEIEY